MVDIGVVLGCFCWVCLGEGGCFDFEFLNVGLSNKEHRQRKKDAGTE